MKKGEIYFADFSQENGESKDVRPVLIISNDVNNKHHSLITVAPLTSHVDQVYRFEVMLTQEESGLNKNSKVQCNQLRTISKKRIISAKPAGKISVGLIEKVYEAIKLHLDIH